MTEQLTPFMVQPASWKGSRDTAPANKILDEEWVDSRNVDSRRGGRRGGLNFQLRPEVGVPVFALSTYRRPDGAIKLVTITTSGKVFDDGVQVLTGVSEGAFPDFAQGGGTLFIANGINTMYWRDPADGVWKALQGVPADWKPKYATFHPLSKRLYVAPTAAGVDYFGWSNPDFVGTNISFVSPGGGSEYVGGNREPITGVHHGLGDDTCIFTTDHVFQIRGLDPSSWRPRFVSGDVGCTAPKSIQLIGHGLFFMHTSGCYLVNAVGALTFPPLTAPKQNAWDTLVRSFPNMLQYSHATWHAQEHTVYLFVPTNQTNLMGQLWKFYLPDGSISVHDCSAYASCYVPPRFVYVALSDGQVADLQDGTTDLGTAVLGWVRSKIYGEPATVADWGVQEKMVVLFKPLASGSVRVKPIIYAQHERGIIEGTLQTVNLDQTGDEIRATITLPPAPGWGLQLYIEGESAWVWHGFQVSYRPQDIE